MNEKILSIVIPSYNVSKYIDQCLDSLTSEIIDSLEVLVIDDGSKDNTYEKARKYEELYPRVVKVIHKENGGHGSTINSGLENAKGIYFRVLDGDDWVNLAALKKLLDELKKKEADLYITNVVQVLPDRQNTQVFFKKLERNILYDMDNLPEIDYLTMGAITVRTSILKNRDVRITEHCYYVDIEFNSYCAAYAKNMMCLDFPIYMYRLGNADQSVAKANMFKNIEMLEKVSLGMVSYFESLSLLDGSRKGMLSLRIGKLVRTTLLLYLADDNKRRGYKRKTAYKQNVKRRSKYIYNFVRDKWMPAKAIYIDSMIAFNILRVLYRARFEV